MLDSARAIAQEESTPSPPIDTLNLLASSRSFVTILLIASVASKTKPPDLDRVLAKAVRYFGFCSVLCSRIIPASSLTTYGASITFPTGSHISARDVEPGFSAGTSIVEMVDTASLAPDP